MSSTGAGVSSCPFKLHILFRFLANLAILVSNYLLSIFERALDALDIACNRHGTINTHTFPNSDDHVLELLSYFGASVSIWAH